MTMTVDQYIAEKRATIDAHQSERDTLAPTLPLLRQAYDDAQAALDALDETATSEDRLGAQVVLEQTAEEHRTAQARFRALQNEIDELRRLVTDAEADPNALAGRMDAERKATLMRGAGIDPARPETMVLFVASFVRLVADALEASGATIDPATKTRLDEGRALLDALSS